jgi:hypothetical protein
VGGADRVDRVELRWVERIERIEWIEWMIDRLNNFLSEFQSSAPAARWPSCNLAISEPTISARQQAIGTKSRK